MYTFKDEKIIVIQHFGHKAQSYMQSMTETISMKQKLSCNFDKESSSSWQRNNCEGMLSRQVLQIHTYFPHSFSQEKCPDPSNPSLSVPHRTSRVVVPQ